jgi:hypothetical protein
MTRDIKDYVRSCDRCQRCKPGNRVYGPHQPLPTPPGRWHTLPMDFAGPFVRSGEGQWDMVLVVVDKFTKRAHFIPTRQSDTAEDTARRFFEGVVRLHGIPSIIVSDRDARFTSRFWQALFERFGTKLAMSTSYHPQTDGQSERMVRTLKDMLRSAVDHRQQDWTHHLAALEFAYNNSVQASTQLTPFELDLGYHPKVPYAFSLDDNPSLQKVEDFVEHLEALQHAAVDYLEHARQIQAKEVNKGRLRPKVMIPGDSVLLSTQYIQPAFMRTGSKKLRPKYIGPFVITKRVSPTSYELDLPANMKVHPVINIEYLKEFHLSPARFGRRDDSYDRRMNDEDVAGDDDIEAILDHRETRNGRLQYLCHYQKTADHDDVWEHAEHVAQNPYGKAAMDRYWNTVYEVQQAEEAAEKKQRKPRKDKGVKRGPKQATDDSAEAHNTSSRRRCNTILRLGQNGDGMLTASVKREIKTSQRMARKKATNNIRNTLETIGIHMQIITRKQSETRLREVAERTEKHVRQR